MPKILLVEDLEFHRDMLRRRLRSRGFEVALAVAGLPAKVRATLAAPRARG